MAHVANQGHPTGGWTPLRKGLQRCPPTYSARVTARARVKSDDGWAAPQVAEALDVALSTVYRVKQRLAGRISPEEPSLHGPSPGQTGLGSWTTGAEAHLIGWPAAPAEKGIHWTLRLLAGKVVELAWPSIPTRGCASVSKNALKPVWQKKEWCIPKVSAEFDGHGGCPGISTPNPYDPQRPVVCFDETSTQLFGDPARAAPAGTSAAAGLRIPAGGYPQPSCRPPGALGGLAMRSVTERRTSSAARLRPPDAGWRMKPTRKPRW